MAVGEFLQAGIGSLNSHIPFRIFTRFEKDLPQTSVGPRAARVDPILLAQGRKANDQCRSLDISLASAPSRSYQGARRNTIVPIFYANLSPTSFWCAFKGCPNHRATLPRPAFPAYSSHTRSLFFLIYNFTFTPSWTQIPAHNRYNIRAAGSIQTVLSLRSPCIYPNSIATPFVTPFMRANLRLVLASQPQTLSTF